MAVEIFQVDLGVNSQGFPSPIFKTLTMSTGTFTANGASTVTVTDANVTANSVIVFTLKTVGGTVGAHPVIQTITPGTGYTLIATAGDTSVYNYRIIG